jgi:hypothetical protein
MGEAANPNLMCRQYLIPLFFCACLAVAQGGDAFPLLSLEREAAEGMVWDLGPINLGGQSFNGSLQGLGSGVAGIGYKVGGDWEMLEAHIGYTKNTSPKRSCKFSVIADQVPMYTSAEIRGGQEPEHIKVSIEGKQIILLRIEPISYGGTQGACFAAPMLKRGLTADEKASPYRIEVNGQKMPYDQFSAPAAVPLSLPVKPGETTYTVKVNHDPQQRKIQVTTSP